MALWGVPIASPDDTENALKACIEMRRALNELNNKRIARGQPALKIGMGLNRGEVIAGNIGSEERMEYTVIGDAVNTASRIESMTKEYGTDLLVSRSVYEETQNYFIFEYCKDALVKGKVVALELFQVLGLIVDGRQVVVKTPYSEYSPEKSDKGVHVEGKSADSSDVAELDVVIEVNQYVRKAG
jgi:adenylate cyclase